LRTDFQPIVSIRTGATWGVEALSRATDHETGKTIAPLTLFWLVSADIPYLVGVQVIAGASWAAYELAVVLLFFETASHRERTGVVTAYNDLLSAHAPLQHYPDLVKDEARKWGATAQVAGGVPAMCDGVTQGTPGMELSLFSRDVIAMSTAVSLSHDVFDAALMLGVCDKIVPGLLIGALHFGHLPTVFVPAGPMVSGLSNNEKSKVREQAAQGLVGRT
jgi:dihydroxyacid dehydratase/phosphogluconate dehydratase